MTNHNQFNKRSCLDKHLTKVDNQTSYPRMQPANQRPRKPDKLSQGAHNQTSYPRIQWENTLDKKGGYRTPGTREPGGEQSQEKPRVEETTTEGNARSRARARTYDYSCFRKLGTRHKA